MIPTACPAVLVDWMNLADHVAQYVYLVSELSPLAVQCRVVTRVVSCMDALLQPVDCCHVDFEVIGNGSAFSPASSLPTAVRTFL